MTSVSVLVPFRGDPGGHRDAIWSWLRGWWTEHHPDWQVVRGFCPDGPWVKALAVADALAQADGDLLVVCDADVFCHGVGQAVARVEAGAGWAVPHTRVHRLSVAATDVLMRTGELPDPAAMPPIRQAKGWTRSADGTIVQSSTGVIGGGAVVLPASTYRDVPLDPRFANWGQEDQAFGLALAMVHGEPWRGKAPMWHLWHPPARTWGKAGPPPEPGELVRMNRSVGSHDSLNLLQRYRGATSKERMVALLAEFRSDGVLASG